MALFSQYAIAAAAEAMSDAGLARQSDEDKESTGVCIGSGIGNLEDVYSTSLAFSSGGHHATHPLFVPRVLINLAAGHISERFGLHGPVYSPTTACTTGLHSITQSLHLLRNPNSPIHTMLAGASEACIHPLALSGFARARSLSTGFNHAPEQASRPFDRRRDGFVIAEGAGVLILEELEHARVRGAHIYAEVAGAGESADAAHMTAPRADGFAAALAMKRALDDAKVVPGHVGYLNAHGTGTVVGDRAENRAIRDVLMGRFRGMGGTELKSVESEINVSSTKGATGHLLGAAGSVESIFTVMAISRGILPPTLNLDHVGDMGEAGRDAETGWDCNYVPKAAQERHVDVALTNSFGFGGTNASVCFKRYH
ncbi:MAG: hypothetical protein M1828_002869 [Chrysothrix sp. TS-e1954]|nr:MAG: hypothetical protein M1828_002869 [Chrysothrix sp. TS-e1954]